MTVDQRTEHDTCQPEERGPYGERHGGRNRNAVEGRTTGRPALTRLAHMSTSRQSSPDSSRPLIVAATPARAVASIVTQPLLMGECMGHLYPGTSVRILSTCALVAAPSTVTAPHHQDRRETVAATRPHQPRREQETDIGGRQRHQLPPHGTATRRRSPSPRGRRSSSYGREPDVRRGRATARHHRPVRR